MIIYISVGLIIISIIAVIVMLIKAFRIGKTEFTEVKTANSKDVIDGIYGNVKDFLPVKAFHNNCFERHGDIYSTILEVSSLNYNLLSASEQNFVDIMYFDFLNSLNFPVEYYIQTRGFDTENMINETDKNIASVLPKFPSLTEYATLYRENIANLPNIIKNHKVKKKFIMVSYCKDEIPDISEQGEDDIKEYILEELQSRANIVAQGLRGVGLVVSQLDKSGMAECMYSYFHRNHYKIARDIANGLYNTLFVEGDFARPNLSKYETFCNIIDRTSNEISTIFTSNNATDEELVFCDELYNILKEVKECYYQRCY